MFSHFNFLSIFQGVSWPLLSLYADAHGTANCYIRILYLYYAFAQTLRRARMSTCAEWRTTCRTVCSTTTDRATSSSASSTQTAPGWRFQASGRSDGATWISTLCGRTGRRTRHWPRASRRVVHGLGWPMGCHVEIFQFFVGWVGLGQSADGLSWIGSHIMDPRTTLIWSQCKQVSKCINIVV